MHKPLIQTVAVGAVLAAAATGCSSKPAPQEPPPGALVSGTAQITVNDTDLGPFKTVQCTPAGSLMMITTGNEASGSSAFVSNADGLVARTVSLTDLGGFTGSYNQDLQGTAEVSMTGNTYVITGTARGFDTAEPSFTTEADYTIKVGC
ncbi:lipoprotein LpqH [Mycolicibacterium palauense]|uniref:lipoprotein LpqH n=1 Tax=Mycolicibacterium palauense TaxID=2034511 RepID=UPI002E21F901